MGNEEPRYLGHYRLLECLAYGGMGEVWKALDTRLNRTVAVKLLRSEWRRSEDFVTRFKSEAQLLASLHHPNIVKIHNFYISEEAEAPLMYMVMEYVEGQTLAEYIRKTSAQGQFPPAEEVVYIFSIVGLALDYAHAHGLIHRDIKPANILLDQRLPSAPPMGEPVLSDFGIARRQGVSGGTIVGSILGTPLYVSPEQAQGNYDEKSSDLYSLGIILYEMMTGVTPFRNAAPMALIVQHIYEAPTPPELINPRISPELSEVILKSIAKRPEDRFPSGVAMAVALAQALHVPVPEVLRLSIFHPTPSGTLRQIAQPSESGLSLSGATFLSTRPAPQPSTPTAQTPGILPPVPAAHPDPAVSSASSMPIAPAAPTKSQGSFLKSKVFIIGLVVLLLALVGAGVFAIVQPNQQTSSDAVVGQIHFSSSGSPSKSFDMVQIDMQNIPPPPAGKVYVAWVDQITAESSHPHWQLQLQNQSVHMAHLTYPNFNNLLIPNSLFIITLQVDGTTPLVPSASLSDRLYYARIGQQPAPALDLRRCPTDPTSTVCV